jgi:hypothetical protein
MKRYRKTYFFFTTKEKKEAAIDLLLALNVPFTNQKLGALILLPKWVNKYDLELRLLADFSGSEITYK